jgi:hypothetical protein
MRGGIKNGGKISEMRRGKGQSNLKRRIQISNFPSQFF